MNKEKIIFLKRIATLDALIEGLSNLYIVVACYESHLPKPQYKSARSRSMTLGSFGTAWLLKRLKLDMSPPFYMKDFNSIMFEESPTMIIVPDFFRLFFNQTLRYKRRNPDCQIVLYTQTKAWPKNIFSRQLMKLAFWYLRRKQKEISRVFVFTPEGKSFFERNASEIPVEIKPLPIDEDWFYSSGNKKYTPNDVVRILMPARYMKYKRHVDLLKALQLSIEKGYDNFHLTLVGRQGFHYKEIISLIDKLELQEYVTLLERVDKSDMREVYWSHDVMILPSNNEAIGMVVPEAMACGVATITSDSVGANVYVKEDKTGFIFPTKDSVTLAQILENIFINPIQLQKLGNAAQQHVVQHYTKKARASLFVQKEQT